MVGTNLGSGTRTYNVNFCEYLDKKIFNEKVYIFISKNYKLETNIGNSNIEYIVKPAFLTNIFFRIIWMQFLLPFELKRLQVDKLYSPMNFGPIFLKLFKINFVNLFLSVLPGIFEKKTHGKFECKANTNFILNNFKKIGPKFIGEYNLSTFNFFNSKGKKNCIHIILKKVFDKNFGLTIYSILLLLCSIISFV